MKLHCIFFSLRSALKSVKLVIVLLLWASLEVDASASYQASHTCNHNGGLYFKSVYWWRTNSEDKNFTTINSLTKFEYGSKALKSEKFHYGLRIKIDKNKLVIDTSNLSQEKSLVAICDDSDSEKSTGTLIDITDAFLSGDSKPKRALTLGKSNRILIIPDLGDVHRALVTRIKDFVHSFPELEAKLGPSTLKALLLITSMCSELSTPRQDILMDVKNYSWKLSRHQSNVLSAGQYYFSFNGKIPIHLYSLQVISGKCKLQIVPSLLILMVNSGENTNGPQIVLKIEGNLAKVGMHGPLDFHLVHYRKHKLRQTYSKAGSYSFIVENLDIIFFISKEETPKSEVQFTDMDAEDRLREFIEKGMLPVRILQLTKEIKLKSENQKIFQSSETPTINMQQESNNNSPSEKAEITLGRVKFVDLVDAYEVQIRPSVEQIHFGTVRWTTSHLEQLTRGIVFNANHVGAASFLHDLPASYLAEGTFEIYRQKFRETLTNKDWYFWLTFRRKSKQIVVEITKSDNVHVSLIRNGSITRIVSNDQSIKRNLLVFEPFKNDVIQILPNPGTFKVPEGYFHKQKFKMGRYSNALGSAVPPGLITAVFIEIKGRLPLKKDETSLKEAYHRVLLQQFWFSGLLSEGVELVSIQQKLKEFSPACLMWHRNEGGDEFMEEESSNRPGIQSPDRQLIASYGQYGIALSRTGILLSDALKRATPYTEDDPGLGQNYVTITTIGKYLDVMVQGALPWFIGVIRNDCFILKMFAQQNKRRIIWEEGDLLVLIPLCNKTSELAEHIRVNNSRNGMKLIEKSFQSLVDSLERGFVDGQQVLLGEIKIKRPKIKTQNDLSFFSNIFGDTSIIGLNEDEGKKSPSIIDDYGDIGELNELNNVMEFLKNMQLDDFGTDRGQDTHFDNDDDSSSSDTSSSDEK